MTPKGLVTPLSNFKREISKQLIKTKNLSYE